MANVMAKRLEQTVNYHICLFLYQMAAYNTGTRKCSGTVQLKCDGTRWHTGGKVNGKLANGVGSQYHFTLPRNMVYPALLPLMPHTSAASSRLNWRPTAGLNGLVRFAERLKSGFCACAITCQTCCNILYMRLLFTDWGPGFTSRSSPRYGTSNWRYSIYSSTTDIYNIVGSDWGSGQKLNICSGWRF